MHLFACRCFIVIGADMGLPACFARAWLLHAALCRENEGFGCFLPGMTGPAFLENRAQDLFDAPPHHRPLLINVLTAHWLVLPLVCPMG